jgi:hypothetical protein
MGKKYLETKKDSLESSILDVWKQAVEFTETNKNDKSDDGEGLDAVQPKAVKKKFKDRKDKDIDNDGDVDDSDKFLHKRRKAVSKAVAKEEVDLDDNVEEYAQNAYFKVQSMKAALAKVWGMEEGHNPFAEHKGTKPHKHPHDEEDEVEEGLEDSPNSANKQHLCAKNVVHEEWGSGQCISTQHADPDEEGNVAWYDVMFEHGIEKGVSINELKVTKAEGHMHASHDPKKKMKKTETGKKPAAIDLKPKIDDK